MKRSPRRTWPSPLPSGSAGTGAGRSVRSGERSSSIPTRRLPMPPTAPTSCRWATGRSGGSSTLSGPWSSTPWDHTAPASRLRYPRAKHTPSALGMGPAQCAMFIAMAGFTRAWLTWPGGRVPIMMMRRMSVLLVAASYGLSFLVVCLGTCFAGAPLAEHACCEGDDGFRAAAVDCCAVTPGTSPDGPVMAEAVASAVAVSHDSTMSRQPPLPQPGRLSPTPSPPLVLRI